MGKHGLVWRRLAVLRAVDGTVWSIGFTGKCRMAVFWRSCSALVGLESTVVVEYVVSWDYFSAAVASAFFVVVYD